METNVIRVADHYKPQATQPTVINTNHPQGFHKPLMTVRDNDKRLTAEQALELLLDFATCPEWGKFRNREVIKPLVKKWMEEKLNTK